MAFRIRNNNSLKRSQRNIFAPVNLARLQVAQIARSLNSQPRRFLLRKIATDLSLV